MKDSESANFQPSIATRIQGLDELRGIAIVIVMIAHFLEIRRHSPYLEHFHLGGVGVHLFFMISGFLIGKILLESRTKPGYFRRFYVRRFFRILPLYIVVVIAMIGLAVAMQRDIRSWFFYATFTQNLISENPPVGNIVEGYSHIPGLGPTWSLAVEEHFYILLPLLVYCASGASLHLSLAAVACLGIALRIYVTKDQANWVGLVYHDPFETWYNIQYLVLGVLLNAPRPAPYITAVFAFWAMLLTNVHATTMWLEIGVAALLLWTVSETLRGRQLIRNRYLAQLGVWCYGLYLFHVPVRLLMERLEARWPAPTIVWFAAYCAICFSAAYLSFEYFEAPIQRLRGRFEPK